MFMVMVNSNGITGMPGKETHHVSVFHQMEKKKLVMNLFDFFFF